MEIWLAFLTLVELAVAAGMAMVWMRTSAVRAPAPEHSIPDAVELAEQITQRLAPRFERLESALELLAGQVVHLRSEPSPQAEPAPALAPRAVAPAPEDFPPTPSPLHPTEVARQLKAALESPEFLNDVWPKTASDFYSARYGVLQFVRDQGLPAPDIQPYPPLRDGNPVHWTFLCITAPGGSEGVPRLLIPGSFVRFDPSFHGHLFEVRGGGHEPESFVLELHRCAVLRAGAPLEGVLAAQHVERRGMLSVGGHGR